MTAIEKTILLVEDNRDDADLMMRAFRKARIANRIVVTRTGEEAVDLLSKAARDGDRLPEVVLLDLALPRMSGFDVLRRIRAAKETSHLPVIVLTSSEEDEDVQRSAVGANAYVCKPVDSLKFGRAVKTLGLCWLVVDEVPSSQ